MNQFLRPLAIAAVSLALQVHSAPAFDLIIRHGRVVDGTGAPAAFMDVAVRDGRIRALGKITEQAAMEIDATGLYLAPGFIDVHTHADDIDELPLAENFVRMGVTTVVVGNCGSSARDLGSLFHKIETNRVAVNVASLIGHNTVRAAAMGGSFMRPPSDSELDQMKQMVAQAMRDGAVGFSTGLIYLPGTFARTEEIVELAKVAASSDGIYVSHMRNEGREIEKALDELFTIAREAKMRAEISHLKASSRAAWGSAARILEIIERARAEGLDITHDQYAYTASSTGISQLIPDAAREGGRDRFRERLADETQKSGIVDEMKAALKLGGHTNYEYARIANYSTDRSLNGSSIVEAARRKRGDDSLEAQIEMILEIEKNGGAQGVFHSMNEDDLRLFLQHPNTMIASDSGVRRYQEGIPHPRGYGNNARVLARYVRELKLLRLEEAIRRMTSLPATTFRLPDRGQIREGFWADLVVFDPAKVQDNATFDNPHHYATGIPHVFVNGVGVVKDGEHTQARPGRAIRR